MQPRMRTHSAGVFPRRATRSAGGQEAAFPPQAKGQERTAGTVPRTTSVLVGSTPRCVSTPPSRRSSGPRATMGRSTWRPKYPTAGTRRRSRLGSCSLPTGLRTACGMRTGVPGTEACCRPPRRARNSWDGRSAAEPATLVQLVSSALVALLGTHTVCVCPRQYPVALRQIGPVPRGMVVSSFRLTVSTSPLRTQMASACHCQPARLQRPNCRAAPFVTVSAEFVWS